MKAEKDKKTGKWLIQYRYTDWQGKRRKSTKRGFATKREAEEWLRNFLITQKADFDMKFENFWKMYYADMETRLREHTMRTKKYIVELKILPYFGNKRVNDITAADMMDARLEEAIIQTKARLVVLDPIQGFLGTDVDMHRANEIRPLMKRVAVLAEKYHCAIILIGHMNKNSNGKSSYRGLGSIDFQAAARSVLIIGRIKDEPEIRVVCHVKSSLAPEGKSIAFRLDKDTGFEWIGEYDISADDLLSGDNRGQKIHAAKEFLQEVLASGSVAQTKVAEEAESRGIKKKTLWNAKKELEIDSVKIGNQWFWMLPE